MPPITSLRSSAMFLVFVKVSRLWTSRCSIAVNFESASICASSYLANNSANFSSIFVPRSRTIAARASSCFADEEISLSAVSIFSASRSPWDRSNSRVMRSLSSLRLSAVANDSDASLNAPRIVLMSTRPSSLSVSLLLSSSFKSVISCLASSIFSANPPCSIFRDSNA
ncbi:hypothetical protein ACKS0A_05739 [Histoplasma ohiense]